MNVAALQQFIRSLAQPLQAAGASQKIVNELEEAGRALEPFQNQDLAAFAAFLRQAEEYHRTGVLPIRSKPARAAKSLDPVKVHELAQQVVQLKESAAGADGSGDPLRAEFDRIDLKALSKKDVLAVAREVGVRTTVRMSQEEAIAAVRRWVLGQPEAPATARPEESREMAEVQTVASESASGLPDMGQRPA